MAEAHRTFEERAFTASRFWFYGGLLAGGQVALLSIIFANGTWLNAASGAARQIDFVVFWSAGYLALHGNAAAAYDWATVGAFQYQVVGNTFQAYPWVYPPTFLLAVAPFALIPFIPACLTWLALTLSAYLAALYAIVPRRLTPLLALASPPVLWNAVPAQNGFLTAALLAGSLVFLESRPVLAGVFLGLLAYKPQFGLLFPLVFLVTGRWRVVGVAALTVLAAAGASYLAFGAGAWENFLSSGPATTDAVFSGALVPWSKLQSVYSLVRWLGGGVGVASAAHIAVALTTALIVCAIWLRPLAYPIKAAALSAGTLIITPRLFVYDMVAIAVPVAFLVQAALTSGFLRGERSALVGIGFALLLLGWGVAPLGWLLLLGLMALIVARAAQSEAVPFRA